MKRIFIVFCLLLVVQGCARREVIEITGSDTMVNLGQAWAEAYARIHPDAAITITGGGSATGIAGLINGDTEIAQTSREMADQEIQQAKDRGLDPREFTVAQDGLSVIVHRSNPVDRLTIQQLSGIFTGQITNWREVGGPDRRIIALSRDRNSGTHVFFLEKVVRLGSSKGPEEFGRGVLMQVSSQSIADEVAQNPNAIGYTGMGYYDPNRHKHILVAQDADSPYVEPSVENVLNRTYPIARPLHFYTPGEPSGTVRDFIDFVLSDEGQRIVISEEFVPIRETEIAGSAALI